jgi:uncharacterized Zn finger protein
MNLKKYVTHAIESMSEKELQHVAEYIASIKSDTGDPAKFQQGKVEIDMIYNGIKEKERAGVEETRAEYQTGLITEDIQRILGSFDQLSEAGKHTLATEILRRTIDEKRVKELQKDVMIELMKGKEALFSEVILDIIEELGLVNAIRAGRKNEFVNEGEIVSILNLNGQA